MYRGVIGPPGFLYSPRVETAPHSRTPPAVTHFNGDNRPSIREANALIGSYACVASCKLIFHGTILESVSRIQDDPSLEFKEFCNFIYLVGLDAHFLECLAKVLEKTIIVPVI